MHSGQGTHCTGKTGTTGNSKKQFPVRENTENLEIPPKHRINTGNFYSKGKNIFQYLQCKFSIFLKLDKSA